MSLVLRAQITIDLNADDFVVAADHQKRVEALLQQVRDIYPQAELLLRERKTRRARRVHAEYVAREHTGRLADYVD